MSASSGDSASWRILVGDALDRLADLDAGSIHTCVTSPPYFGLRDYGNDGQIGRERTPDEFVRALVAVFRWVRRALRDDGTVWLNLGDSYASSPPGKTANPHAASTFTGGMANPRAAREQNRDTSHLPGVKPKDLLGIPWLVAFALRADGWYLRSDVIWAKPNPMPESVTDRPTKAHEYLFLLSKGPHYYYDADAIRDESADSTLARANCQPTDFPKHIAAHGEGHWNGTGPRSVYGATGANKRSVWTVATQPYSGAHFATFPPKLIEPCILAGCPEGGIVLDPFAGSGTTGMVALRHSRSFVGVELNPTYAALARDRIIGDAPLLNVVAEVA